MDAKFLLDNHQILRISLLHHNTNMDSFSLAGKEKTNVLNEVSELKISERVHFQSTEMTPNPALTQTCFAAEDAA